MGYIKPAREGLTDFAEVNACLSPTMSFLEFVIAIIVFVVGFGLFLYHRPSHPLFQIGGIMLFTSLFPLVHTLAKGME